MPPVITVAPNGHALRAIRRARRLTIAALSHRVGVTAPYLSKVEREVKSPSLDLAERLAGELQVELGALLREPAPRTESDPLMATSTPSRRRTRGRVPSMPCPDPEVQPILTVPEAGQVLGLKRAAAYAAANSDDIPVIRVGRRLMVPTAELRKMLGLS